MDDCIFCKIARGDIPSKKVYEDDKILCFHDLNPQAPVHVLIIPKCHIEKISAITQKDEPVVAHLFGKIPEIAQKLSLEDGFRLVANCGESAGQTVFHLHFHLLGGKVFSWPPG